jgi:hypothetical protein
MPPGMDDLHALARRMISSGPGAPEATSGRALVEHTSASYARSIMEMSKRIGVLSSPPIPWCAARGLDDHGELVFMALEVPAAGAAPDFEGVQAVSGAEVCDGTGALPSVVHDADLAVAAN